MLASLLVTLALAAQPASDDGPVQTAPKAVAGPVPGLDEKAFDPSNGGGAPPPAGSKPTNERRTSPAAVAATKALTVEQKTLVEGGTLQIVLGQRAVFRLDDKGLPVLGKVEEGQLTAAHPKGSVNEAFEPPPEGHIAVALDGSAEVRATILKIWNQTDKPVDYAAIALVMRQGKVTPTAAPVCAVPAKSVRTETWKRPVVAVGLTRFNQPRVMKACEAAGG